VGLVPAGGPMANQFVQRTCQQTEVHIVFGLPCAAGMVLDPAMIGQRDIEGHGLHRAAVSHSDHDRS